MPSSFVSRTLIPTDCMERRCARIGPCPTTPPARSGVSLCAIEDTSRLPGESEPAPASRRPGSGLCVFQECRDNRVPRAPRDLVARVLERQEPGAFDLALEGQAVLVREDRILGPVDGEDGHG